VYTLKEKWGHSVHTVGKGGHSVHTAGSVGVRSGKAAPPAADLSSDPSPLSLGLPGP
jgi:hypothetical protein